MKPAFIPNIDDANNEVARLTEVIAAAAPVAAQLTTANTRITELMGQLEKAGADLTAANTKATELTGKLETANAQLAEANTKVTNLGTELAASKASTTKTLAKAGVRSVPDTKNPEAGDKKFEGLKGLQRAIAANADAQSAGN